MTPRPGARRTPSFVLLACLALSPAGCGGGSSGAADPSSSGATSPSASSTSPAVDPADGRKVSLAAFTARTPVGYDYDDSLAREIVFSSSRDLAQEITYSDVSVYPGTTNRFAARLTIKNSSWQPDPRIGAPVTVAGVTWYHLSGPVGDGRYLEDFGTVQNSRLIRISFQLQAPPARRKTLVDSVLATVRLK